MFSIVGTLVYAVVMSTTGNAGSDILGLEAAYIAVLHFVLPFGVFYSISTNSPGSRVTIAAYFVILFLATIGGKGYLGAIQISETTTIIFATAVLVLVLVWLLHNPKMRYYYAAISNKPIPSDLEPRVSELSGKSWLSPRSRAILEWVAGHLETVVLIGFILAAIYAFVSTG